MRIPIVDPVGLTVIPSSYNMRPRRYSPLVRLGALSLILIFCAAVFTTGVISLARYCMTSHAGLPFPFSP